ncbi:DHHC palmitoyltransferase-domain-containing protein [Mucidula mucida]|nr:DHHC palmitoyltransferase-domain-containing protein [Mucidula mucida]
MICSRTVFRCFKALERLGDRITGAAGPYFVGLAVLLISTGAICFFDVIMPSLSYPLITGPICILISLNLFLHYYYVCTIPPGFVDAPMQLAGTSRLWAQPLNKTRPLTWSSNLNITRANITVCRKCAQRKPERTHHCRICNRCVLKYDHHCPVRINQCVGLHNERHFVMFMAYLCLSSLCFVSLGYEQLFLALGVSYRVVWPYHVPPLAYMLLYILSAVIGLAVGIMCSYHLWMIMQGETSVESQDHEHYRRVASERGETFVNSYDLGKLQNLRLFFNIGPTGYSHWTLFVPLRVQPYTDGNAWARPAGYERHRGVREGEELTDDEETSET